MDAQKAMELAAKDEAEDVEMGAAEEEEDGQQRLEQGPPKAPAKVSSLQFFFIYSSPRNDTYRAYNGGEVSNTLTEV